MSVINKDQPKEGIKERINLIKRQISSIVPSAILLKKDIYTFFAIIPYKSKSEFDSFIVILEQILDSGNEWICGVSKSKNGIYDLPNGWNESSQALRYHSASAREGIIFYKNIETLFSSEYPEVEDLTNELIRKLNNPETRKDIIPWFPDALISITSNNISITEFQTLSIRCLIEINAFLQDLSMDSNKLRNKLNAVLGHILTSNSIQDTVNCVAAYLEWIIECLNQSDADKDGKCIIDEIQSFIRQHYNENITLNMLAEQFFLHPNYLSRLFKEKTGDNFVDYLTEIRIDKAKDLLKNTDNKIIEICYIVGYNNSRYFNKVFKQHTGMTPSKYRQTSSS